MNTPILPPGVAAYVAAVRAHLDDLTNDEIDELTGGLEADLDDALGEVSEDGNSPEERFGPPAVYAAELRMAAGLPPRAEVRGQHGVATLWNRVGQVTGTWTERVRAHPRWPATHDFLLTIRPAWWVLRAMAATIVIRRVLFDEDFFVFVVLALAIVVSVELGRRGIARRSLVWRGTIAAGNTLAVLMMLSVGPIAFALGQEGESSYDSVPTQYESRSGLQLDGAEVRNVFPYDEQGRPLRGIQLYDQDGRLLEVGEAARESVADEEGRTFSPVPAVDADSVQRWNAFPLRRQLIAPDPASGEARAVPGGLGLAILPSVSPRPLIAGRAAEPVPTPASPVPGSSLSAPGSPTAPMVSPTTAPAPAPTAPVSSLAPSPTSSVTVSGRS
ncbi:MAG: hypothetical protein QG622_3036 [Actinomycetota bacterium]|nr:hypothetical protein [Actinomycetota bacterium]